MLSVGGVGSMGKRLEKWKKLGGCRQAKKRYHGNGSRPMNMEIGVGKCGEIEFARGTSLQDDESMIVYESKLLQTNEPC